MTQEEKQLLTKDLCARLPYGVKAITKTYRGENVGTVISVSTKNNIILGEVCDGKEYFWLAFGSFKHYLRPMSNMTKDEEAAKCAFLDDIEGGVEDSIPKYVDWLNASHFDYHGLIGKGLALEAPEGMYAFIG